MIDSINTDRNIRLAFMLSNWYSGATLFAILLTNHDTITCNGETFPFKVEDIDIYMCSCGKPLIQCEHYRTAAAHMMDEEKQHWDPEFVVVLPQFSKINIINRWLQGFRHMYWLRDIVIDFIPPYRKKAESFPKAHLEFFINSCKLDGSKLYLDGTKSIRRAELFARHSQLPFKIIHLVRDGRGFCYSYIKNNRLPKDKLPHVAKAWLEYIELVDIFSLRYPDIPVMIIRYEDLCSNLNGALSQVCEFLELPSEDSMTKGFSKPYHMLGNAMRKTFDGKVKEDLSWQSTLTHGEIAKITNLMKNNLTRFGYI